MEIDDKLIFCYGSNLAGRNGLGAALYARKHFGAGYGIGAGPVGRAYAIPTKDSSLKTLPLDAIFNYVCEFLRYARANPDLRFFVTRIGCGLAGYKDEQIAPMFKGAPDNCDFPDEWKEFIKERDYDEDQFSTETD